MLVAVDAAGYATYGDWRTWDGYRNTVEHSVCIQKDARGQGVDAALMLDLIQLAASQGKHVMPAATESTDETSLALHRKLGFIDAGRLSEVGCKFVRWLGLSFLQLYLDARAGSD